MLKKFTDKIKSGSKIALFGAGNSGSGLKKYIEENRPDIKILFYVDSYATGEKDGLKIVEFKDLDKYAKDINLLVMATRKGLHELDVIFNYLNLPFIVITKQIEQYFRVYKSAEKIEQVLNILDNEEDKKIYKMVWELWLGEDSDKIQKYAWEKHCIKLNGPVRNYGKQYHEYINKDAIKTVFDAGVCNGAQFFTFKSNFKNLKKVYGFEPMYEKSKNANYDTYIQKMPEIEIVPFGLWEEPSELTFIEHPYHQASSYVQGACARSAVATDVVSKIKTTTIDEFKKDKNVEKVDFIKMDIEGSELPALKGGEKTFFSDRPQLAISIYHSAEDMVEIPLYLGELLKDQNYSFRIGHYSAKHHETVFYAIPKELIK